MNSIKNGKGKGKSEKGKVKKVESVNKCKRGRNWRIRALEHSIERDREHYACGLFYWILGWQFLDFLGGRGYFIV